jgi:hypothetical protein
MGRYKKCNKFKPTILIISAYNKTFKINSLVTRKTKPPVVELEDSP